MATLSAVLIECSNPSIPDPATARSVTGKALEPLVDLDIETQELLEQAAEIETQNRQIAAGLQQDQHQADQPPAIRDMYQ